LTELMEVLHRKLRARIRRTAHRTAAPATVSDTVKEFRRNVVLSSSNRTAFVAVANPSQPDEH
jgi:hypothetical protein